MGQIQKLKMIVDYEELWPQNIAATDPAFLGQFPDDDESKKS